MKERMFYCADCRHTWSVPFGAGRPQTCPKCGSNAIHREHVDEPAGPLGLGQARRSGSGFGGRGACGAGRPGRNRGRGLGAGNGFGNH
ncbi:MULTISPECIES: hypothetical protein [Prosthecochloris]|uniref:hypothetical protein n=1 Tax=Prosthecochloris TaxID=1101 RepID=UPI000D71967A|nr:MULTISPECIES: hypothetical protein [Prosthecochloris]UZJ38725.1 hydrogenase maturation nickel metallochaperone HypA [Prosthecochloris sp. SCSIO W1103]